MGEPGTLVNIGDSIAADPTVNDWFPYWVNIPTVARAASPIGCPTGANTFGKQVARGLGLDELDYSCTGMAATKPKNKSLGETVATAIADGALSVNTRRVLVTIGANDAYDATYNPAPGNVDVFVEAAAGAVDEIKAAAPNARVQIVGYPTIADGDFICPLHVIPSGIAAAPAVSVPQVRAVEVVAQEMQVRLAQRTGVEFVDMKPSTAANGMCSPDGQRQYAGVIDTTGPGNNLPFHANAAGHAHIAEVLLRS
ncbi:GDSL-type esterase/lipase family protein [Corynebacterium qintianiae]|uniref:GDSL-type esterase/lipase family protein n=1 Tax=Corynebacterium qintianiae TaxID=2709392 RepID=UPI0013ED7E18|nr:GDSL-type esterase/lipase family protein [Corynebacterium qintianiae]